MDTEVIKFSIDNVEWIDSVQDSLFREIRLKCFASGVNAHTLPIDKEVLKKGAQTVYDKPIVWKYSFRNDDAMSHEEDEIPAGFVKESTLNSKTFGKDYSNPITFEEEEDGRLFMYVNALIWTRYCGRLIEIFERDDGYKSVSIEMAVMSDTKIGRPRVDDYVIAGITILGEDVRPAVKGAKATLLNFAEDKKTYISQHNISMSQNTLIPISDEVITDKKWSNPRNTLYFALSKADNKDDLFKEAYLMYDSNNLTYSQPHHIIQDGKLKLHVDGLHSAMKFAISHNMYDDVVKDHILRHYQELGINSDNYVNFGVTESEYTNFIAPYIYNEEGEEIHMKYTFNQIRSMIENALKENGTMLDTWIKDLDLDYAYVYDYDKGVTYKIAYTLTEEGGVDMKLDEKTEVIEGFVEFGDEPKREDKVIENAESDNENEEVEEINNAEDDNEESKEDNEESEEEKEDSEEDKEDDSDDDSKEINNSEDNVEEVDNAVKDEDEDKNESVVSMSELQAEIDSLKAQIVDMSDYAELKAFKEDTINKEKRETELNEMNTIISDIETKGISFSDEEKEKFIAEFSDFSGIDAWSNHVKASIFDKIDAPEGIVKIGMPYKNNPKSSNSVWDE